MRCLILVVAACAFVGALAVPVADRDDLEKSLDNAVPRKEEKLVDSLDDRAQSVAPEADEAVEKDVESVTDEIYEDAKQEDPSKGQSEDRGQITKEQIRQKIVEIRDAIASATSELAKIIWQQALEHGGKISESLAIAREKVVKRIKELRDELLVKIREAMIPDDDVPVTYIIDEVFEQIIDGFKEQISDALKVVSDWHNLLSESGRAKIAEAKKSITELAQKIADTIREWNAAKDSDSTTKSSNYISNPFHNDKLMIMLKELLEDLKVQLELNMLELSGTSVGAEQEIMAHIEEVTNRVTDSLESVRKVFEEETGVDVSPFNIIANLRKLLLRRLQELQELIRSNADGEKLEMLEQEVLNLRRRLIKAVQDVFQRP